MNKGFITEVFNSEKEAKDFVEGKVFLSVKLSGNKVTYRELYVNDELVTTQEELDVAKIREDKENEIFNSLPLKKQLDIIRRGLMAVVNDTLTDELKAELNAANDMVEEVIKRES